MTLSHLCKNLLKMYLCTWKKIAKVTPKKRGWCQPFIYCSFINQDQLSLPYITSYSFSHLFTVAKPEGSLSPSPSPLFLFLFFWMMKPWHADYVIRFLIQKIKIKLYHFIEYCTYIKMCLFFFWKQQWIA